MPRYQFHALPLREDGIPPAEKVLFDDSAAIRRAMGGEFPDGCDVWQGDRYVGRFHPAARPG